MPNAAVFFGRVGAGIELRVSYLPFGDRDDIIGGMMNMMNTNQGAEIIAGRPRFKLNLLKLRRGDRDGDPRYYLPVSEAMVWFRFDRPTWRIHTEYDLRDGLVIFTAEVLDDQGQVRAIGHGCGFISDEDSDFLEKAETGAIGRALNALGYNARVYQMYLEEALRQKSNRGGDQNESSDDAS